MPDEPSKSTVEQLWEFCLYAPIGLAFSMRELKPELINKGRQQVNMARFVGTVAGRKINKLVTSVNPLHSPPNEMVDQPPAATQSTSASPPQSPGHLALADYDSLAASQIVARLESLTMSDLTAIHDYETAGRGRRTILAKIHQLNSAL